MNNNTNDINDIADNLLLCDTLTYDIYNKYFNTGMCKCINCDAIIDLGHVYEKQTNDYSHDIYNTIMSHVQQHYNLSIPNTSSNIYNNNLVDNNDSINSILSNSVNHILNDNHAVRSDRRRSRRVNHDHRSFIDTPEPLSGIISSSILDIINQYNITSNISRDLIINHPHNDNINDTDDTDDTDDTNDIDNTVDDTDNTVDDTDDTDSVNDYAIDERFDDFIMRIVRNSGINHSGNNINEDNEDSEEIEEYSEEEDESYDQEECEYTYRCPVCENGYNDQFTLGRHFIRRHNDYNSYTSLDQKRGDGFPGFEVLIKIGMLSIPKEEEKESIDETCIVCCDDYTHTIHDTIKTYEDNDKNIKIYDDLLKYEDKNIKYNTFNDDMKLIYLGYKDKMPRYPIKMKCCRKIYCSECLRKHINAKNGEPECPFCRRSFIQDKKQYIIFDERPESKIKEDPTPYQSRRRISYIDYTYDTGTDEE